MRPSPAVLASFGAGAGATPVPLPGGQGTAWRAGDGAEAGRRPAGGALDGRAVPEPVRLPGSRLPRPPAAAHRGGNEAAGNADAAGNGAAGDWIAEDPITGAWVAWQWLPGEPAGWAGRSPSWPRLIEASRAFHAALAGRPAPSWLGTDGSPWTTGDQVAWGERDPGSVLADAPGVAGRAAAEPARGAAAGVPARPAHPRRPGRERALRRRRAARRDRLLALLAARRAGPGRGRGGRADVERGRPRRSSASWRPRRDPGRAISASCWPARWCTGSSPRSSSGAAIRPG